MDEINCEVDDIRFPGDDVSQDQEWCEIVVNGTTERIRFHDYHKVYPIPGLYERVFYEKLECNSPYRVAGLLKQVLDEYDESAEDLRFFDVGAGNGMVGEELAELGVKYLVGLDIIPEAKVATERDRPGLYDDYLVSDLTDLPEPDEKKLRRMGLNAMSTVAALGFGDIPARAFIKSLDVLETPAWLAFNIKEDFLEERDTSGFSRLVRQLMREGVLRVEAYQRYRHRLSLAGEPLYYVAMVARKVTDLPDHHLDQ
jgi:predicted TPR repeat methyltransferase